MSHSGRGCGLCSTVCIVAVCKTGTAASHRCETRVTASRSAAPVGTQVPVQGRRHNIRYGFGVDWKAEKMRHDGRGTRAPDSRYNHEDYAVVRRTPIAHK